MRDQWRFEDALLERHRERDRVRDRSGRRQRSPLGRAPATDRDWKAGREGDSVDTSSRRSKTKVRDRSQQRGRPHTDSLHRSPPQEYEAGLRESKRSRYLVEKSSSERHRPQQESLSPVKHQRTRSTSVRRDRSRRLKRGASRSPKRSYRSIRNHRIRAYSPRRSPDRKHLSRHHSDRAQSPNQPVLDSYLPPSQRRRSRSPALTDTRLSPRRRNSRSRDRTETYRHEASPQSRSNSRRVSPRRYRNTTTIRPQQTSPYRRADLDIVRDLGVPRRHSPSTADPRSRRSLPARQSSHSRTPPRASRRGDNDMRSTRPIQSILEDDTRPPSPPRPIPSFDADISGSVDGDTHMREAFPMHGMKATDLHSTPRPRRLNIDTRQSYAASPQYMTPNSSHHGSPQSGSPFNTNRGGWVGQQQQFHGQHG